MSFIPTTKSRSGSIEEAFFFPSQANSAHCSSLLFPKGRTELNILLCVGILLPSLLIIIALGGIGRQLANSYVQNSSTHTL